ncbi:uncharacterized protein LOC100211932 isoform X1 [Hydra vulgaris]|uniref:uncharacterized protein LOC100211932 isoform X1 n=1 Tax=Hydra vulgaris TaxID=6087 RepID=UPI00019267DD|nr:uncharacterized protein LOC100211932 [Hydra vulgaris]
MQLYKIMNKTGMKLKLFFYLTILQGYCYGSILTEDFLSDDDQKVSWDKNSNSLDDIFKTIPFFKFQPSEYNDEENNLLQDPTQIEEIKEHNQLKPKVSIDVIMPSKAHATSNAISNRSISSATSQSSILSTVFFSTQTSYQIKSMTSESRKDTSIKNTYNSVSITSAYVSSVIIPSIKILNFSLNRNKTKILQEEKNFILESTSRLLKPTLTMEMTYLVSSTPVVNQSRFTNIHSDFSVNWISDMNIRLPDENGYGSSLESKEKDKENKDKNFRYLYSYIIIPIMSGVIGALTITFVILLYNCIKKRKLKKVRYYGAENVSDFYRLDQINLLSTSSSDED